ncbi:hypothetical protein [Streptomyces gilvosporeus]|uniref:hypothetical protein n=1 Tax=Streptomyces gilvosporeus TaxID=553510 RepID=UPI00193AD5A5|nr:hypothetical protein [Streptomyces gilvosporeus]
MFLFRRGTGRRTPEQARTGTSDGTAVPCDVREVPQRQAGPPVVDERGQSGRIA